MDSKFHHLENLMNKSDEQLLCTDLVEYLKNSVEPGVNTSGKGDHVPELERLICITKDGVCSLKSGVRHFKKFP